MKEQGTQGGAFTAGAWQTRDLNTVLTNTITGASLTANQITLPAGKYYVEASAPCTGRANLEIVHVTRLHNITDTDVLLEGCPARAHVPVGTSCSNTSSLFGNFALGQKKYCLLSTELLSPRAWIQVWGQHQISKLKSTPTFASGALVNTSHLNRRITQ